ncbi:hypothetical protein [Streptomyces scopuliridis]|uniref:hypothetical protein n=1 Tax=Streptomyces scopuliridis TaxID=452529 RepID=UPI00343E1A72
MNDQEARVFGFSTDWACLEIEQIFYDDDVLRHYAGGARAPRVARMSHRHAPATPPNPDAPAGPEPTV